MNPFRQAAAEARNPDSRNYSPALARRIEMEGKIVGALVKQAIASGFKVSVFDGEEWAIKLSQDRAAIMAELFATDGEQVAISRDDGTGSGAMERFGTVQLIYGNDGYDVIADWRARDMDAFSEWMKPISEYADKLAG